MTWWWVAINDGGIFASNEKTLLVYGFENNKYCNKSLCILPSNMDV